MPKVRYPANPGIVVDASDTEVKNAKRLGIPIVFVDEEQVPETKSPRALYKSQGGHTVPVQPENPPADAASTSVEVDAQATKEATQ